MKKLVLLIGILAISYGAGFELSHYQSTHRQVAKSVVQTVKIWPTDVITYNNPSGVAQLTAQGEKQLVTLPATPDGQLQAPVPIATGLIALHRSQNYTALEQFDQQGDLTKTLLDGDHQNFDKMIWVGDPGVSSDQKSLVFVSDKDRFVTGMADNAVYSMDLGSGNSTLLAKPTYLTGGFANPTFNPQDANQLLLTNYLYDQTTFAPYSVLELLDLKTHQTMDVTTKDQNAFQPAFSPDGQHVLFLSRTGENAQVQLWLADLANHHLMNLRMLASGQFAYPRFSNSPTQMYYLAADKNSEFQLETATITATGLANVQQITTQAAMSANSAYTVTSAK